MPHKNYDIAHLQTMLITEHRIKRVYEQAIDDFMRIYDWMEKPESEDDTLEFDKQPLLKPQVEKIMKRLGQGVNVVVVDGVKASWNLAQEKNNELTRKIFGRAKIKKLTPEQLQAYFTRNEDGLAAFLERKIAGMNLSDRVWKLTASFKEEMEIAIEQGMRDGRSADQLSRDIRQYLKQPNMLFRRVRDKKTGRLRLSKRAANYHPGQGVYRSSYKNARRLASTEGNIAYRTADHERWLNSDFVVGYEIHLSNNHTCLNNQGKAVRFHCMCDDLQGKYPKQFKFTGWHPHCRCFATPILKTEEEMARDIQLILEGKDPLPQSENEVKTMPKDFETWMERNQERIANAKSLPYFIKDNFKDGDPLQGYLWNARELTLLEKAKLRHKARTPEQEQAIRDRWEERRKYHKEVKDAASASLATAEEYSEVDTAALRKAVQSGQIARIKEETEKLNKEIQKAKEEAEAAKDPMAKIIPNLSEWKKKFSPYQIEDFYRHIESNLKMIEDMDVDDQLEYLEYWAESEYGTFSTKMIEMEKQVWNEQIKRINHLKNEQIIGAKISALDLFKTESAEFAKAMKAAKHAAELGEQDEALKLIGESENIKEKLDAAALKDRTLKKTYIPINTNVLTGHGIEDENDLSFIERLEQIERTTGVKGQKVEDLYIAVHGFSHQWDTEIRAYQVGKIKKDYIPRNERHTYEEIKKKAENLEEYILRSPKWAGGKTYRGLCMSKKEADKLVERLSSKDGADMLGTSSWSTKRYNSEGFARQWLGDEDDKGDVKDTAVVLTSKSQKRATSIKYISHYTSENEVVSSKENRYRIVSISKRHEYGTYFYEVEVEPI
jgi:hypothetical protein